MENQKTVSIYEFIDMLIQNTLELQKNLYIARDAVKKQIELNASLENKVKELTKEEDGVQGIKN